jgi:AraC-like DNA-binding protein
MSDAYYEALKDTRGQLFAEIQKEYFSRYHFHRAFELAYVFEGEAQYQVEDKIFSLCTDQIVFVHCYYRHRSFDMLPHKKYVIAVPEKLSPDVYELFSACTLPHLLPDREFNRTLLPYFKALYACDKDTPSIVISGYVNLIFGLLLSHYKGITVEPKSKNVSVIADILNYIDKHLCEPLCLAEIAGVFGYNPSYFSRLFNRCVGVSLNRYINFARLDRYMLLEKQGGEKSATERILEAGFPSIATFYRTKKDRESFS